MSTSRVAACQRCSNERCSRVHSLSEIRFMRCFSLLLGLCLLATNMLAHAEGGTCPSGYYPISTPGSTGCAPIPGYNQQQTATKPSMPRWESRWEALATDAKAGALGTATGRPSQESAEKSAIKDCQAKGGKICKLQISNANGCMAMIVGENVFNVQAGATESDAIQKGMKQCSVEDKNCRTYYSSCSLPTTTR